LLHLGETFQLHLYLPDGYEGGDVYIFPRYLETAEPGDAFQAGGDLSWVEGQDRVRLQPDWRQQEGFRQAAVVFTGVATGNYLARWTAGGETFYRYFAIIDNDYVVVRFHTHLQFDVTPTLHATGIPLSYRLPVEKWMPSDPYYYTIGHEFAASDPVYQRYLRYHRLYGDLVIPDMPDTEEMADDARVSFYKALLDKARQMLPDTNDIRSARVEKKFVGDPGYPRAWRTLGVDDHCGMWIAFGEAWLGMPEFPYYESANHSLRVKQDDGPGPLGHQWDFAGSFHFLGPADWHYFAARGDGARADRCIAHAMEEFRLAAEFSGHPIFVMPLYDGAPWRTAGAEWADEYHQDHQQGLVQRYVEHYQRLFAFELTKRYKLAFARSLDVADYYRRHFSTTPRTIFVNSTDHTDYDKLWAVGRCPDGVLPADLPASEIHAHKRAVRDKLPRARETVLIEDQRRQLRFERECPSPIWYFDYADDQYWTGAPRKETWVETPDVAVDVKDWTHEGNAATTVVTVQSDRPFSNYAICLWDIPSSYAPDGGRVQTNAKEAIMVRNVAGELHLVLLFDLKTKTELRISIADVSQDD